MANPGPGTILWTWRTLPRYAGVPLVETGVKDTRVEAIKAAEDALNHPDAMVAQAMPITFIEGEWIPTNKAILGIRANRDGITYVKWYDPATDVWL